MHQRTKDERSVWQNKCYKCFPRYKVKMGRCNRRGHCCVGEPKQTFAVVREGGSSLQKANIRKSRVPVSSCLRESTRLIAPQDRRKLIPAPLHLLKLIRPSGEPSSSPHLRQRHVVFAKNQKRCPEGFRTLRDTNGERATCSSGCL